MQIVFVELASYFSRMKKSLLFFLVLFCFGGLVKAQSEAPVAQMMAYQEKFEGIDHYSGTIRWQKQGGINYAGSFVVEGEKYHLTWEDGELFGDGEYEWEVMHRSKRIKKRFYDPLVAPGVVTIFRLIRLDMTAEPVKINQKDDQIAVEIEFGSSVAQGNHLFKLDVNAVLPESITMNIEQNSFYEKTDIANIRWGDEANDTDFTLDFAAWKKKGYSLTDMAKGDSDVIWPEERALR